MEVTLQNIPEWLPRIALTLVAIVVIFLLRRVLARLLIQPVKRFAHAHNAQIAELIIDAMELPASFLIFALAFYIGIEILRPDQQTGELMENLMRSLIILALLLIVYRFADVFALSSTNLFSFTGLKLDERLVPILRTAMKIVIGALAVIIIMQEWGVDVSGLVASLGIIGLAFSLAAQDTVSNLFGFSTIVGDRPFVIGEYIRTPDVEGIVEHVGIRSTRIRKPDRARVTVPNSKLAAAAVEQFSRRRIDFVLGVTYQTTADQMETLLERLREMLTSRTHVIASSVAVYFTEFGDSALNITIFCDLTLKDWRAYMKERETINLAVMRIVAELGLSVAFPTRSIHVATMPPTSLPLEGTSS